MAGKRRGKGDGSIFQTKNGTWRGYITLDYGQRKYATGETRKEVAEKLRQLQRDQEAGRDLGQPDQKLADYLAYWLQHVVRLRVSERTLRAYADAVNRQIVPALGAIKLNKLTPEHVQMFLNDLLDSGLRPRSVVLTRSILVSALQPAVRQGKLPRNVASLTEPPKDVDPFKGRAMSPDEVKALLEVLAGQRLERLYRFLLLTGCRKGEALSLTWDDVNPDAATLTFRVSKTGARTIGLSPTLLALLKEQRIEVAKERLASTRWSDHNLVFPSSVGKRIEHGTLHRHFKRMLGYAGIENHYRIHDLRHTAISLMAQNGIPIRTVMQLVGHKRMETTLEIYSHATQDDQAAATEVLARLFGT